jgi:arsenate reductase
MKEIGIDISTQKSRHIEEFLDTPLDYVITVCGHANETCPVFPRITKVVHVGFDDPPELARDEKTHEDAMRHYRRVRDEIRAWIMTLPESLPG